MSKSLLDLIMEAGGDTSKIESLLVANPPKKTQTKQPKKAGSPNGDVITYNLKDLPPEQQARLLNGEKSYTTEMPVSGRKITRPKKPPTQKVMKEYHTMQMLIPLDSYKSPLAKACAIGQQVLRMIDEDLTVTLYMDRVTNGVRITYRDVVEIKKMVEALVEDEAKTREIPIRIYNGGVIELESDGHQFNLCSLCRLEDEEVARIISAVYSPDLGAIKVVMTTEDEATNEGQERRLCGECVGILSS